MSAMTGKERIDRILRRKPVDRIGLYEHFWGDTQKKWMAEGHLKEGESAAEHFGFDMQSQWAFKMIADYEMTPETVEETETTILQRDGNGALLRRHKLHNATPEHVDFAVKDRASWEELIKPLLKPDRERIRLEEWKTGMEAAREAGRFFTWGGTNVFELIHPVCGHENFLMGMLSDPDWIKDMAQTYSDMLVSLFEILFDEVGPPDGVWFYEDMGYKLHPFISPDMYREFIQPGHSKTIEFCHARGLPVIMHSCGFIEPLVPAMIESGIDCLQVIEIKAGMDLLKLKREFGDRLSLCGGMDARNLVKNDRDAIAAELREKIPVVKKGGGYILHSDHSIPNQCEYETYRFFVEEGLRLGQGID